MLHAKETYNCKNCTHNSLNAWKLVYIQIVAYHLAYGQLNKESCGRHDWREKLCRDYIASSSEEPTQQAKRNKCYQGLRPVQEPKYPIILIHREETAPLIKYTCKQVTNHGLVKAGHDHVEAKRQLAQKSTADDENSSPSHSTQYTN